VTIERTITQNENELDKHDIESDKSPVNFADEPKIIIASNRKPSVMVCRHE
jgi:hypothetical protein